MKSKVVQVEYADVAEVEHDNGSIYFIVELNTVREDEKGETITETLFFKTSEDAEEYDKIVLEGDESFDDCAKRIGFIE